MSSCHPYVCGFFARIIPSTSQFAMTSLSKCVCVCVAWVSGRKAQTSETATVTSEDFKSSCRLDIEPKDIINQSSIINHQNHRYITIVFLMFIITFSTISALF